MNKNIVSEELNRIKTLMGLITENEIESNVLRIPYITTEKRSKGRNSFVVVKGISREDKDLIQLNPEKDIILVKNNKEISIGKNPFRIVNIDWDPIIMNNDGKFNMLIGSDRSLSYMLKIDKTPNNYQKVIKNIFREIYSNKIAENGESMYGESVQDENCRTNRGVINYRGIKYGENLSLISNWSILNYFDTNVEVISKLLELFSNKTNTSLEKQNLNFEEFKTKFLGWLTSNGEEILGPDSIYLDDLEKLNLSTIKSGIINEQNGIKILRKIHNIEEGGITEYCPGSIQDTRFGRDLKVNEEDLYYQIKPFAGTLQPSKIEEFKYLVPTRSMKKYNPKYVDRLLFVNDKGNKYVIFENKDYEVSSKGDYVLFKNDPLYVA
jgi:hypothetical protein